MIKAVIFDVDGVLFDSFEANLKFFQDLVESFSRVFSTVIFASGRICSVNSIVELYCKLHDFRILQLVCKAVR